MIAEVIRISVKALLRTCSASLSLRCPSRIATHEHEPTPISKPNPAEKIWMGKTIVTAASPAPPTKFPTTAASTRL